MSFICAFMYRLLLYQDEVWHDDVANLINDDSDANVNFGSLDKIPFDNEVGEGVYNEPASSCLHKEPTTPLQPEVYVCLIFIFKNFNQYLFFPSIVAAANYNI